MNGIRIIEQVKDETKDMLHARKLAFLDDVLEQVNKYRADCMIEFSTEED